MSDSKITLGNRDAKIMRENEGKTPYELLQLGLSKAAYERLLAAKTEDAGKAITETAKEVVEAQSPVSVVAEAPAPLTPTTVEQVDRKKIAAQPRLGRTAAELSTMKQATPKQVRVLGPTGIPQLIAEKQALKLVARNPNLYKII